VVVLEDDDVLHVAGGGYGIYNAGQRGGDETVPRALQTLQVEVDQIMKVRGGPGVGRSKGS
jgi:glucosamine--fructose-6-phosphate aminotransferase (isomerizing)